MSASPTGISDRAISTVGTAEICFTLKRSMSFQMFGMAVVERKPTGVMSKMR